MPGYARQLLVFFEQLIQCPLGYILDNPIHVDVLANIESTTSKKLVGLSWSVRYGNKRDRAANFEACLTFFWWSVLDSNQWPHRCKRTYGSISSAI